MDGLILIFGITAFCAILAYIAFSVDREVHFFLQFLLLGIVMVVATTQIPRAVDDYAQDCDHLIMNESVAGNTTTYGYAYTCENVTNIPSTFYKSGFWTLRVFFAYLFFYLLYVFVKPFKDWFDRKKGNIL